MSIKKLILKVKRELLSTVLIRVKERHYYHGLRLFNQNADKVVALVGYMSVQRKKPFFELMTTVSKSNDKVSLVVLDEVESIKNKMWNTQIKRYMIPSFIRGYRFVRIKKEEVNQLFNEYPVLEDAAIYWEEKLGCDLHAARKLSCLYFKFWNRTLDVLSPSMVVIWHKFNASHMICDYVCKQRGIIVNYCEFGVLPGTYNFDISGQMGESQLALEYDAFKKLPISDEELHEAGRVWDYLKESGLNRNEQTADETVEKVNALIKKDRPVLLFAGNYDCDSGIVPYTAESKKYHSPFFESSYDALVFLSDIAKRNDWNLIFKPHPSSIKLIANNKIPDNAIYFPEGNLNDMIDCSDVIITLMSQTAYIACIRYKPTVMLGFNQLRGKDCIYQPDSLENIEKSIQSALTSGFTKKQQLSFKRHIAQLNKYYLFNDCSDKEVQYGRNSVELARYILNQIGLEIEREIYVVPKEL